MKPITKTPRTPKKIMDAAEGEDCTLCIVTVCNYDPATTVFAHFSDGTGGSNRLTGPLNGGFACSSCHDVVDGRKRNLPWEEFKDWYMRRSANRTINRLIELGLVKVAGLD